MKKRILSLALTLCLLAGLLPCLTVGAAAAAVLGQRTNGKQGKCIDTCNFRAAETLVGVPPNPLDFWPP